MPVFRKHTELRLANGVKAFLNLDAGVVRGEVSEAAHDAPPDPAEAPPEESPEIESLRGKLEKKDRELAELRNEVEGGPPIPPAEEIHLVTGARDTTWFIESGKAHVGIFRELLERNGLAVEGFGAILDFGCGCGRMIRHWSTLENTEVHGADYNPRLIAWCEENLDFARFEVNELEGRLPYEDGKFDFVYALSVFTHLTEAQCGSWIRELSRVLRPGGCLLITTHGHLFMEFLPPDDRRRYESGELVVRHEGEAGSNECAAFHPDRYVRETLSGEMSVVDHRPGTKWLSQDIYLLRKP